MVEAGIEAPPVTGPTPPAPQGATAAPVSPPPPKPVVKTRKVKAPKPAKKQVPLQKPKDPPLKDKMLLLEYFPELFLGQRVYQWQKDVLRDIGYRGSRVALKAANGSGKTSTVAVPAILWHMMRFPGSQTVCTAGVYRQVVDVLWPELRRRINGMGGETMGWNVTESHITYLAPGYTDPAMCLGFSASDANKAEGYHGRGRDNNLFYVIDEAKGVSNLIFEAMERCQPTRLLVMSSPGGCSGAFYDIFNQNDARYDKHTVTAAMCPHIKKEDVDALIAKYGERSQLVRSMIYAEFGDTDGNSLILPATVLQRNLSSPPSKTPGPLKAGCDFAAGGDENVIQVIEGNAHKQTIAWREKDTMAAVGRFVTEFKRLGLEPDNIYGDGSGMGINMCDALREAGWAINRVNNGEGARDNEKFANRGTEMYVQFARLVETGKIILPVDELLNRQLTTRQLLYNSKGKLIAEPKPDMRKRGIDSPDRADALVLAYCGSGPSFDDYMQKYGRRVSIFDNEEEEAHEGYGRIAGAWCG